MHWEKKSCSVIKKKETQISNTGKEKGDIVSDPTDIRNIIKGFDNVYKWINSLKSKFIQSQ